MSGVPATCFESVLPFLSLRSTLIKNEDFDKAVLKNSTLDTTSQKKCLEISFVKIQEYMNY